jgi:uncharacterized membrane protein
VVLADITSGLYKLLFLGHIVSIMVAFAPAAVHPILGAQAEADGEGTLRRTSEHMALNTKRVYFPALVLTAAFGIGLVLVSDDAWGFDQAWVSLSFLVWIALCGVVSGIIMPGERKVGGGEVAAMKQVAMGGQIATVLLLVMLYLMIWKPGL